MTKKAQSNTKAEAGASAASASAANTGNENPKLRNKLQPYFDAHPSTNVFYVTSDGQPFFEAQWAREHQKTVDPKEKVSIVNR